MVSWAQKIRTHGASKQPKPRKAKPEVQSTWAQTRHANLETGDPGAVIIVHYTVEENTVKLTDDRGKPIDAKATSYVLQPGETAIQVAKRMALANWSSSQAPFNRPLVYPRLSVA
jgi:hypothetical protein